MFEDLQEFVHAKQGCIKKFVAKSQPFQVMIVVLFDSVLCEYQIKVTDKNSDDKLSYLTNKFNHLLYEFERAETMFDLVNAIDFTVQNMREKKADTSITSMNKEIEEENSNFLLIIKDI